MLVTIYYIIGILLFLSVLSNTIRFNKIYSIKEWKEKYEKIIGRIPDRKDYRAKKEYFLLQSYNILSSFEILWVLLGLITNSWYIFAFILILSYILNIILNPIKWSIVYKIFIFTFILVKISLYLWSISNYFYFKIDTYKFILNQIQQ
jgi:hypothetical protein